MDKTAVRIINVFDTVDDFVFSVFMLTLPFGWQISIIPLILFSVLMFRKALQERNKPEKKKVWYFLPVFAFFLSVLLSLMFSADPGKGADLVFRKVSLLLLPLLLLFSDFNPALARKGFRFFIFGTLLVTLFYFVIAFYNATHLREGMLCIIPGFEGSNEGILDTDIHNNYFLGEHFSFLMHPSYFGVLLTLSIAGTVYVLMHEHRSMLINRIAVPVFVLSGIALILLSTNGALVTALFTAVLLIALALRYKHYLNMRLYWMILTAITLLFGTAYHAQFTAVTAKSMESGSLDMRKKASVAAWEVIKENPITGTGIGDLENEMNKTYQKHGWNNMYRMGIDPHNQFLRSWAESGLLALISLLWMIGTLVWYGIKRRSFLMLVFAAVFTLNMFFESMLNRYWGILFFAVFYTILFFHSEPDKEQMQDS